MAGPSKHNSLKQPKEEVSIQYIHKPPSIPPNYANQKRSTLPKSKISRVLLYDNASQDYMLGLKLNHIDIEKERICRILNLNKRTFSLRQKKKPFSAHASKTGSKYNKHHVAHATGASEITHCPAIHGPTELNTGRVTAQSLHIEDVKLPKIGNENRHLIIKVKDSKGSVQLYHTVDEKGLFGDLLPMHNFYRSLTDDPRFRSLEKALVPSDN